MDIPRPPKHRSGPAVLPEPDTDARAHSARVVARIRAEMDRAGGRLPFDRYMELALYAPGLGYYVAGSRKLGGEGDFVTAPEISPLFGRCLAHQCAEVLAGLDGGDILEFGAGSGAMAGQLLEALERLGRLPGRYLILEPSPELRERQAHSLGRLAPALAGRIRWLDALPRTLRGLVLANEVLDAMPVHRFRIVDGAVRELFVRWGGDGFEELAVAPGSPGLPEAVALLGLAEGYESEVNLRAGPWLAALGRTLEAGVALLLDYGYPRNEYYLPERSMGTLMCHYRHRAHSDPYFFPGLQDITAHVDFSAVAQAGNAAGLRTAGYCTQAHFLLGCGMEQLLAELDPGDPVRHMQLLQGAKQLLLPSGMGERFQVLALARGYDLPLLGFALRDLRERL